MNETRLDVMPQRRRIKHGFGLIGSGTTPRSSTPEDYFKGSIPWVTSSELRENVITETAQHITHEAFESHSALKLYPPGTVLFTMYGATIGRVAQLGIEACVNQAVCALAAPHHFDTRFAFYALQACKDALLSLASGGGQPNLNAEKLCEHYLPQPPLADQRAIAQLLDRETKRLDVLVTGKEQLLGLLEEKRHAFTFRTVTRGLNPRAPMKDSGHAWLGEIPSHWEVKRTKRVFSERDDRSETGEAELLTVSHITGVTERSEKDVNMFEAETKEGYKICSPGNLVINTLWAWMGAMGIAADEGIVSPAYHVYELADEILPGYVDALVRTPAFTKEVTRFSTGVWSSRLRLYPEGLFEVRIPVPPLDEQKAIVAAIEKERARTSEFETALRHSIALLKERRAALITAAVTGKIAVPADRALTRIEATHEN